MNEILGIIIAAIVCWLNFVIIDTFMGLPEQPGVIGAKNIGEDVSYNVQGKTFNVHIAEKLNKNNLKKLVK